MKKQSLTYLVLTFLLVNTSDLFSQELFLEGGIGVGNVTGGNHSLGKGEVFISAFKSFKSGTWGLDIAGGGNIIPGSNSIEEGTREILSPNDTRFASFNVLYRLNFLEYFFLEPRVGFTSLNYFVHTDDRRKISRSSLSSGLGVGGSFEDITASLRVQYLGKTPEYQGTVGSGIRESRESHVTVFLVRVAYRLDLSNLF